MDYVSKNTSVHTLRPLHAKYCKLLLLIQSLSLPLPCATISIRLPIQDFRAVHLVGKDADRCRIIHLCTNVSLLDPHARFISIRSHDIASTFPIDLWEWCEDVIDCPPPRRVLAVPINRTSKAFFE